MSLANTTTTPYLPQELVDHIIDHLHNDLLALSNCSLVCHAWLPTSRLHLFGKVTLKVSPLHRYPPNELCKRLYHMLTASPHIIPNIHELEICEGTPSGGTSSPGGRSTTWVTTERTLPPLLKSLTHLKRLDFSSLASLHWGTLPRTLQSAIAHLFAIPTLTYIRLGSWSFPNFSDLANLLASCQSLKGLVLTSTRVYGDGQMDNEVTLPDVSAQACFRTPTPVAVSTVTRRCPLEFLVLDYVAFGFLGYWFLSQQSTIEIKSLRELRVAHFHDVTAIERLLEATGSSLEHFHLKPGPWDVHSFDLGRNSGLRSIRLTLEDPARAITWVKTLLYSISTSNVLERIGIEFFTDLKKMDGGWADLDSLLVRPEFSCLSQVDIGLFAPPTHAEFVKVKEELSGLESRGILRIYQLGIKSQRSSGQLMPRISRYEYNS